MNLNEFKTLYEYKKSMVEPDQTTSLKGMEFNSLVGVVLQQFPHIKIRDFIDVDSTFAVIMSDYSKLSLREALNLYQSIRDIVAATTYSNVINEGLITLDHESGFWIQLG
jgi:hypothetical protein